MKLPLSNGRLLSTLISVTYDRKSIISYRAIEAFGIVSKEIAKTKPELVRNAVGRLLWMIRDESGGIGWSSPEMLGEIVRNNPELFSDVAPVIMSFLDEEMLASGVLIAAGRIGEVNAELISHAVPLIISYLQNPEPSLRGIAAWALGRMRVLEAESELEKLRNDISRIAIYEEGEMKEKTIGQTAEEALERINSAGNIPHKARSD
ncbi:MAG: HEAT repeat domain-containing protein [Thermodesulfovibrionales bacterium]|nr:HEAT repeat domain-containing protein [Thermodesulfovibrionales bacterium]